MRRWCPPLLGLEPHCPAAGYLARRRELGVLETGRRLLRATGVSTYLVDTGLPGDLTSPAEVAVASGADAREIVRLESLAEQIADTSGTVESFLVNLAEAVHTSAASAAAFTSVAAARHGLGPDPGPPGPGAVRGAAGRWLAGREAERRAARTGGGGLNAPYRTPDDPVLLRHLLWTAVACGRPLQFHLHSTDPQRLAGFAAATAGLGSDLVLLHSYPYHRHAAQLASVHPHVYADVGAALARTGARAAAVLAEILEAGPVRQAALLQWCPGVAGTPCGGRAAVPRCARPGAGRLGGGRRLVAYRCHAGRRDDRLRQCAQGVRAGVKGGQPLSLSGAFAWASAAGAKRAPCFSAQPRKPDMWVGVEK